MSVIISGLVGGMLGFLFLVNGYDVTTWQFWVLCVPLCFLCGWHIRGVS
jgi:hypothetical protein